MTMSIERQSDQSHNLFHFVTFYPFCISKLTVSVPFTTAILHSCDNRDKENEVISHIPSLSIFTVSSPPINQAK